MFLLGRHSLMARPQDTVSVFWKGFSPVFFICIIFKKEAPGETGGNRHHWGTARALLSNLQLVSWRDNIGDVVL